MNFIRNNVYENNDINYWLIGKYIVSGMLTINRKNYSEFVLINFYYSKKDKSFPRYVINELNTYS